jgi:hypothetical protein
VASSLGGTGQRDHAFRHGAEHAGSLGKELRLLGSNCRQPLVEMSESRGVNASGLRHYALAPIPESQALSLALTLAILSLRCVSARSLVCLMVGGRA